MKLNQIFTTFILLMFTLSIHAQTLGDFKEAYTGSFPNKLENSPKRVYIATFKTNFEIFKDAVDYKGESGFGGVNRGASTARLAVGLDAVKEEDLKRITNQLYDDFVKQLTSNGYTIVNVNEVAGAEEYSDQQLIKGGEITPSGLPGFVSVTPEDYSYYVRGYDKDGKEKKKFSLTAEDPDVKTNRRLSKEKGNIIVAKVDLYLMFSDEKSSWSPGASSVKIETDLRLINEGMVSAEKMTGLRLKGSKTFDKIMSVVSFTNGDGYFEGRLKKPLEIDGVVKKETIKASAKGELVGSTSFTYAMDPDERESRKFTPVSVDSKKYADGAYMAFSKMLTFHTNGFFQNANGGK